MATRQTAKDASPYYSFSTLLRLFQRAPAMSADQLRAELESPEVKDKFLQHMKELFPAKERTSSDPVQDQSITFKLVELPLTYEIVSCLTQLRESLNISYAKAVEYLDIHLKNNPKLVQILRTSEGILSSISIIEDSVAELYYLERAFYLKSLYSLCGFKAFRYPDYLENVITRYIEGLISSNFLSVLYENYVYVGQFESSYLKLHPSSNVTYKIKEEVFLLKAIFTLITYFQDKSDFKATGVSLIKLFTEQKFAGSLTALLSSRQIEFTDLTAFVSEVADQIYVLQLSILLSLPMTSDFISEIKKTKMVRDDQQYQNKFFFFATIVELILLDLNVAESVSEIYDTTKFYFHHMLVKFIEIIKKNEMGDEPGVSLALKRILQAMAGVNHRDSNALSQFFEDEDQKTNIFLKILKIIFSDDEMLCNYMLRELKHGGGIDLFIHSNFASYPSSTSALVQTANILIGSKKHNFAEEVMMMIAKLDRVTVETNKPPDLSPNENIDEQEEFTDMLRTPIQTPEGLYLEVGTSCVKIDSKLLHCKHPVNFVAVMYRDIVFLLNEVKAKPRMILTEVQVGIVKLFTKFIISSPNMIRLLQQKAVNPDFSEEGIPAMSIALVIELHRALKQNPENAHILYKLTVAIQSLMVSHYSRLTRCLITAQPWLAETRTSVIDAMIYFQKAEEEPDLFRYHEKYHIKTLCASLQLATIVFSDIDYIMLQMGSPPQKLSEERKLKDLSLLASIITNGTFLEKPKEIEDCVLELIESNFSSGILDDFINQTLNPMIKRFLNDDFDFQFDFVGLKYQLHQHLFHLVSSFVQNAHVDFSKATIASLPSFWPKMAELVSKLNILEMITNSFQPRINTEIFDSGRVSGLDNKHYIEQVRQKRNTDAEKDIIMFLISALNLLSEFLDFLKRIPKDSLGSFRSSFFSLAEKDGLFSYQFTSANSVYKISLLLAIASLLELRDEAVDISANFFIENLENIDWRASVDLFESNDKEFDYFLAIIEPRTIFGRVLSAPSVLYRSRSLHSAVWLALQKFVDLWSVQDRSKRPSFVECFGPTMNETPQSITLLIYIVTKALNGLLVPTIPLLNFLQACVATQASFIDELSRVKTDSNEPSLFLALQKSFEFQLNETVVHRLLKFVMSILTNFKSRLSLYDKLGQFFIENLTGRFFQMVRQREGYASRLFKFIYGSTCEGRESGPLLEASPFCDFATNFNLIRSFQILHEELVFDDMVNDFSKFMISSMLGRYKNTSGILPTSIGVIKRFSETVPYMLDSFIGQNLIALHKLESVLFLDYIPGLMSELNGQMNTSSFKLSKQVQALILPENVRGTAINSPEVFCGLRLVGISESSAYALTAYTTSANIISTLLNSKKMTAKCVHLLTSTVFSVGLNGVLCGSTPSLTINHNLGRPAFELASELKAKSPFDLEPEFESLSDQLKSLMPDKANPYELPTGKPELSLRQKEKLLAFPYYKENMFGYNLINMLAGNRTFMSNEAIFEAFNHLSGILHRSVENLEKFCTQFNIFDEFYENIDATCFEVLEIILKSTLVFANINNHLVENVGRISEHHFPTLKPLQEILQFLSKMSRFFEHEQSVLNRPMATIMQLIHQILFALKGRPIEERKLLPLFEFVSKQLELGIPISPSAFQVLDLILELSPKVPSNRTIALLCQKLTSSNLTLEAFNDIVIIFTHLVTARRNEEVLLSSGLFKSILGISCLSQTSAFNTCQFYAGKKSEPTHVVFCRLIELFIAILSNFKSSVNVLQFSLGFISKFQARIEALIGLNFDTSAVDDRFEVNLQFRNLNYLTEVSLILQAVSLVAKDSDYWKSHNSVLFNRILFHLCFRTARLFASENSGTKTTGFSKSPPAMALADRIPTVSSLEEAFQAIQLTESGLPKPQLPTMSANRQPTMSTSSDFARFREFKASFIASSVSIPNLFVYRLELVTIEALCGLALCLTQMIEIADIPSLIADPSQMLFDENFFRKLAPSLVDHQLHLLYAYQKLQFYPESYKEAQLRSVLDSCSFEAYNLSFKSAHFTSQYSVKEIMHIVRKSFEMFFFLQTLMFQIFDQCEIKNQHYYSEELKKQKEKSKSLLQDFEKAVFKKENLNQLIKESMGRSHSPYKSVGKLSKSSRQRETVISKEDEPDSKLVSHKSLDAHSKFLDFIRGYYNIH